MDTLCPIDCIAASLCQKDFLEKHSTFVLTASSVFSALLATVFTYFLKSRCSKIDCLCIKCEREVDLSNVQVDSEQSEQCKKSNPDLVENGETQPNQPIP